MLRQTSLGVSFHDDDLMSFGAPESQRRAELDRFKKGLDETGIVCSMATTNLFWHPMFKDGAFTSNDRSVRRVAIQKTMRNIDVAAELGAPTYVFWGGREGVESAASKEPGDALDRFDGKEVPLRFVAHEAPGFFARVMNALRAA